MIDKTPATVVLLPEIGSWFRGNGKVFEVVAVDDKDHTVEIQHFDGTVEEMDVDAWREMIVQPIDAPEDWSGSMDVGSEDLPGNDELRQDFGDPLDFVDSYEG